MYIMFGDEADADQGRGQKFFVYGAAFINSSAAEDLHDGIERLREKFGYGPRDSLKFSGCPKGLTLDQHTDLKKEVVKLARNHDVVFCGYVISHAIARGQTHDNLILFGANTIIGKYNEFLAGKQDVGFALFDRMQIGNPYQYLKDKFQVGLELQNGGTRKLEKVIGFGSTCDGASHLASLADILVGSFRHCINEPDKDIANAAIFPTLIRVMWHRETANGTKSLLEYGLALRPEKIEFEAHKKDYDALTQRLAGYLEAKEEVPSSGVRPISSVKQQSQMAELSIGQAITAYRSRDVVA